SLLRRKSSTQPLFQSRRGDLNYYHSQRQCYLASQITAQVFGGKRLNRRTLAAFTQSHLSLSALITRVERALFLLCNGIFQHRREETLMESAIWDYSPSRFVSILEEQVRAQVYSENISAVVFRRYAEMERKPLLMSVRIH
ncbi:hypothetical protein AAFF_G00091920, partial [Aldrovandia affinis]